MILRVQVANKLHEGRARASHSLHASLQTVDKPHCNGRGFAHARPTMLCFHLVMYMYVVMLKYPFVVFYQNKVHDTIHVLCVSIF